MAAFGANSSSSSSACSASKSCSQDYDVFINHRGPDIKHTFATALYRNLEDHGVRVFFDKSEMQVGDNIAKQLEEAILDATVHVAIFTPKYAESKWCLEELCLMVESAKSDRATTLVPVFHNIKPADLRWTDNDKSGPYAVALRQHEEKQRHGSEKVQNWRNALSYVAGISGLDLAAFKGGELELLSEVVQIVVKNVPKPLLFVAKHPTGIQQKVEEFTSKVLQGLRGEEQAKVVGIVGSGGVGKTTMAKHFFNANRSIYGKSSFLANVAKMSLKSLQRQLIKDLKGRDIEIQTSDEGVGVLERNLSNCYALIVLDDIDHVNQLDAFLPIKNVLCPNSLLLVTSRDKQVLRSANIKESFIYHLKELNTEDSREFFCRHAFEEPHIPPPDFNDFVDGLSKACYGLPLALKVLGASLCGNDDKSYWEELLNGLDQIFPKEIQERLRVSYDSLNHQQKQIFLDIACFCVGEESDKWKKVWSGSGWQGHVALRTLQDKCLIELDTENTIKMHDLLIVMGRNIAQEQSLPIRRCCGTSRKVFDLLHESLTNKIEVRGIRMDPPRTKNEESFRVRIEKLLKSTEKKFQIENLQILEGEGDFVERMLKLSTNLISLRWNNCRCSRLPSFPMQDLRVLEVNGMELGRLWEDEDQAPEELLQLNIDAPQLEFLPKSLGKLRHLEKLVVRSTRLTTMPESLRDLRNLQHIALVGCENLGMLPDSLENLRNLRHVDLTMCKSLRVLPDSMEKLKEVLEFISLYSCKNLEKIPNWLLDSKSLNLDPIQQWLLDNENPSYPIRTTRIAEMYISHQQEVYYDFTGFSSLKMLPDSLRYVYFLRHSNSQMHVINDVTTINLTGCESLRVLPEFLGEFTSLRYVNLGLCKSLEVLPESFGKLEVLRGINLSGCESLRMLPHSWGSPYLRHLHLKGCRSLTISIETRWNYCLRMLDVNGS